MSESNCKRTLNAKSFLAATALTTVFLGGNALSANATTATGATPKPLAEQ